jgi:hypothetical protein
VPPHIGDRVETWQRATLVPYFCKLSKIFFTRRQASEDCEGAQHGRPRISRSGIAAFLQNDFHSFARELRVGKSLLA